jgi:hypothetical protein
VTDNPFVHANLQDRPPGEEGPLDPERHGQAWYIDDVGGHGTCFAEFQAAVTDVAALRGRGRLVVVEGPPRSGKTSLINRCRDHLMHVVGQTRLWDCDQSRILTSHLDNAKELLSASELRRDVCRGALFLADWLDRDYYSRAVDALDKEHRNDVQMVYALMSRHLEQNRIAGVVLPQADLDRESTNNLEHYDRIMAPGMIFFAERTTTSQSPPLSRVAASRGRDEPLILRLANLDRDEIHMVVRRRLGSAAAATEQRPAVADDVYAHLADLRKDKRNAIGYIVEVFRELFGRRISGGFHPPDLLSIQWAEVSDLLVPREEP